MNKYNEAMEHIDVTEEMQSRILQNVERHFSKKKTSWKKMWMPLMGTVAAAAVIMLVISPWNNNPQITQPDISPQPYIEGSYGEQVYQSADELSKAVGFNVPVIENIPFDVNSIEYRNVFGYAEVCYIGEEDTLTFVKSKGNENNSGIYNEYPIVEEINIDTLTVTIKGNNDHLFLAIWSDEVHSYSLIDDAGISRQDMISLIREVLEKEK